KQLRMLVQREKPSLLLCAGDISVFEQGLGEMLFAINQMGKAVIVHGNHESEERMADLAGFFEDISFVHNGFIVHENVAIVGHGGGGFDTRDRSFERTGKKLHRALAKHKGKSIFIMHAPPYGTALDAIMDGHRGSKSYREFIEKAQPDLAICGHFHEHAGKEDRIGKTRVINPGPRGMVIEL
ncbi:hypothetical protein COV94_02330, partial [Candidatus Woesearchaeota archaeon CG11_big_fil_rev_8_21_14_0_20_57_5]